MLMRTLAGRGESVLQYIHGEATIDARIFNRNTGHGLRESWLLRSVLLLVGFGTATHLLVFAASILKPVLIGFYLAVLLYRPMKLLAKAKIPEKLGGLLLVLSVLAALIGSVYLMKDPALRWIETVPDIVSRLESQIATVRETINEVQNETNKVEQLVDKAMEQSKSEASTVVIDSEQSTALSQQLIDGTVDFVWLLSVTLLLTYFFLVGGDALALNISLTVQSRSGRVSALKLIQRIRSQLAQYIGVTLCVNVLFGLVISVVLFLAGAHYALLWGVLVGLMRYIPYIGTILGIAAVTAAVAAGNPELAPLIAAPAATAVLMFICGNVVDPFVHARQFELNPIIVFLAIIFWSWIWGLAGLLTAVPTLLVVAVICGHIDRLKRFHQILLYPNDSKRSES